MTATAQFHSQMYQAYKALDQEVSDRMLIIAGVGYKTLFRLAHEPRFFGPWKQMTKVISRVAGDPHREGDGRVPLASAALESHGGLIWELLPAEDLHSARINESRNAYSPTSTVVSRSAMAAWPPHLHRRATMLPSGGSLGTHNVRRKVRANRTRTYYRGLKTANFGDSTLCARRDIRAAHLCL